MFDPVAYLMGAAGGGGGGGGGGASLLLNYKYQQPSGSTPYTYDHTVTIPDSGTYLIVAYGYVDALAIYINGDEEVNDFDNPGDYAHFYQNEKTLSANDSVRFLITGSGYCGAGIAVVKL